MADTKYDILVIGWEIAGLISAALLANKGFRVAVVPGAERYGKDGKNECSSEGPFFVTGLENGPVARVFDDIGLQVAAESKSAVSYQVILPGDRVDVFKDAGLFHNEMKRCFPSEIDKISAFYSHLSGLNSQIKDVMELDPFSFRPILPFSIIKGKRSISSLMKSFGLSAVFQAFIESQIASFSTLASPVSSVASSSLLESGRKGVYSLEGGKAGLQEMILQRFEGLGGDLVSSEAREISSAGNRWLVRTSEEAISGAIVIGNMHLDAFCGLFLDIGRKYLAKREKVRVNTYPLTVNLGVRESGIPEGMAENIIILKNYAKEISFEDVVSIQVRSAAKGKKSLSVRCRVPAQDCRREDLRSIAESLLESVDQLCPFIDRHIEMFNISPPDVTEYGIHASILRQNMGVGVMPYEILRGEVLYAGREVFPGLGFDGLIYSGEMAARGAIKTLSQNR